MIATTAQSAGAERLVLRIQAQLTLLYPQIDHDLRALAREYDRIRADNERLRAEKALALGAVLQRERRQRWTHAAIWSLVAAVWIAAFFVIRAAWRLT